MYSAADACVTIRSSRVGGGSPCYLIAEIGMAHDGSLALAQAHIDAAIAAGADAVKFQAHVAEAESTSRESFRVEMSGQDQDRFGYWRRTAFTERQWKDLAARSRAGGLDFIISPFSVEAVDLLGLASPDAWKVASGEVTNSPLLGRLAATDAPVLVSSGMSTWSELDAAVHGLSRAAARVAVMQCTSEYPCPPEELGLHVIEELRRRYGRPAGLSDHSGTIFAGLAARAIYRADLLEVHLTLSRRMPGPDTPASVTVEELAHLRDGLTFVDRALTATVDKDDMARRLEDMRRLFSKSIVAARRLPKGSVVTEADVKFKKPGDGLPPERLSEVIGRRVRREVAQDEALAPEMLE